MVTKENYIREELLISMSDLYKDAYGIRPRSINFSEFTDDELINKWNSLIEVTEINAKAEAESVDIAISDFNKTVNSLIESGANDHKTALKWLVSSLNTEEKANYCEIEQYVYLLGFFYTPTGKKLFKELLSI